MFEQYLPIFVLLGIAIFLAIVLATLSRIIGPYRPNKIKLMPYESGMDPVGQAKERYSIAFYLVAMEFIVFDLEVAFLFPWALALHDFGWFGFISMMVFLGVLTIGFIYEWKKGALEWE